MARNSRPDAQIVSSLVRVRNRCPRHADEVAEVEQLEDLEVALGQRVLADVDLDARLAVGQHQEVGLAEAAHRQDAPGGHGLDLLRLELRAGPLAERRHQIVDGVRPLEGVRIRIDAELDQLVEVGPPLFLLIGLSRL